MQSAAQPSDRQLEETVDCLREIPEIVAAYLHGSAAKGGLRPDSDIDIALLARAGANLPPMRRFELGARLETLLGRRVDLGLLSSRNLVYASQVAAHGRLLFTRDRLASGRFMAQALAQYADLQTARRAVLESYAA